ncbi:enoyl-CoA hydratase/isomerase family protein [Amycolatopsis endophytica]|uniref:enoyl-CoA hydratase/isomerase family protein n=1 Tax=Amycolatopsis endophytica TaxID=860233 RepID=UPI0015CCF0D2|nr:enoyl-CoA hydratase/isomerase family protein [Amycolatopsis endophytica]
MRLETEPSGLAVLTIDAGPLNLYTLDLHADFDAALDRLGDARALLVRAEGKIVSGGVDVSLFAAQETPEQAKEMFDRMLALPEKIAALEIPTVFAAHGLCLTWAFEVAVACDLILAASSASFGLVEKVVGLTPTMGGTQRLAARAGVGRAKEFVMTGERYPASALEHWGVVNRVLPDDGFDAAARAFATALAEGPTRAHAATKKVLDHFSAGGVAEANTHITTIAADLYRTEDLRNAVRSFLAEGPGKAKFTGR